MLRHWHHRKCELTMQQARDLVKTPKPRHISNAVKIQSMNNTSLLFSQATVKIDEISGWKTKFSSLLFLIKTNLERAHTCDLLLFSLLVFAESRTCARSHTATIVFLDCLRLFFFSYLFSPLIFFKSIRKFFALGLLAVFHVFYINSIFLVTLLTEFNF